MILQNGVCDSYFGKVVSRRMKNLPFVTQPSQKQPKKCECKKQQDAVWHSHFHDFMPVVESEPKEGSAASGFSSSAQLTALQCNDSAYQEAPVKHLLPAVQ